MDSILNIILSGIWYALSLTFYFLLHRIDGFSIVEVGYRSPNLPEKVIKAKSYSYWDSIFYWNLCKEVRKSKYTVWVYFALNIIPCLSAIVSTVLFVLMLFSQNLRKAVLVQLGFMMFAIILHSVIHFVVDIFLLPSVRKKYGFKQKNGR